jgi:hypothetical protein
MNNVPKKNTDIIYELLTRLQTKLYILFLIKKKMLTRIKLQIETIFYAIKHDSLKYIKF